MCVLYGCMKERERDRAFATVGFLIVHFFAFYFRHFSYYLISLNANFPCYTIKIFCWNTLFVIKEKAIKLNYIFSEWTEDTYIHFYTHALYSFDVSISLYRRPVRSVRYVFCFTLNSIALFSHGFRCPLFGVCLCLCVGIRYKWIFHLATNKYASQCHAFDDGVCVWAIRQNDLMKIAQWFSRLNSAVIWYAYRAA